MYIQPNLESARSKNFVAGTSRYLRPVHCSPRLHRFYTVVTTAVHEGAKRHDPRKLQEVVKGVTALHVAVRFGTTDVVRMLVSLAGSKRQRLLEAKTVGRRVCYTCALSLHTFRKFWLDGCMGRKVMGGCAELNVPAVRR